MSFQYTYKPNPKISDIYNSLSPGAIPGNSMASSLTSFMPTTRTLPNDAGTYSSPVVTPENFVPKAPTAPGVSNPAPRVIATSAPQIQQAPQAPARTDSAGTVLDQNYDYSKYTVNGQVLSPKDFANYMASKVNQGTIPNYVGDIHTQGPQTTEQLQNTAAGLNNQRNDIAVGATDPYKVASQSGIAYSPQELAAIEKAYAGIYDPAINSALSKLDQKQKQDAANLISTNKLKEMAQQHAYDISLKRTPTATESANMSGSNALSGGTYVPGADPIVDGWVDKINRTPGASIETMIPGVANQSLRNKVMLGLNAKKYESATANGNIADVNTMNTMLANPKLDNISGPLDQYKPMLFGQAATAKTEYDQIVGILQLAKAGQIKGQGQISDYERKILKESSAAIDRGLSDSEFRKALVKLRGVLMTSAGVDAPVKITDTSTGESDIQTLNTQEINKFIRDGAIIEYVEQ